jgi:hypothetical protein
LRIEVRVGFVHITGQLNRKPTGTMSENDAFSGGKASSLICFSKTHAKQEFDFVTLGNRQD